MRNLKRMLSLALAAAMLMSMMVVSAGASYEDFTDSDEIVNTEAVNAMVNLGILTGNTDGSFDPDGTVTRGQMAKIICLILTGGEEPTDYEYDFTDIEGHWSEQFVAYCAYNGIIDGYNDGTFKPSDPVNGYEAAKMILTALGYDSDVQGYTGSTWKNAINNDGSANKLFTDLKAANSSFSLADDISRDDVAEMIFTGLNSVVVTYPDGVLTADATGTTLLEAKYNVETKTGVVTANDFYNEYELGYTTVGGVNYEGESGASVLGRTVSFYVQAGVIIGAVTATGDDEVIVLEGDGTSMLSALLTAYDEDTTMTFATVAVDGADAVVIDLAAGIAGATTDVLEIGEYAEVIVADDVASYALLYTHTFGQITKVDGDDYYVDGIKYDTSAVAVVGYEDLEEGDYVNYIVINGVLYLELADSLTGEYTRYTGTSATDADTMTVDGTKYTTSDVTGADATVGADLDQEVTVYFDMLGNIAHVEGESTDTDNYAYVTAVKFTPVYPTDEFGDEDIASGAESYTPYVQVVLDNGDTDVYEVASIDSTKPNAATYLAGAWTALDDIKGDIVEYAIDSDGLIVIDTIGSGFAAMNDGYRTVKITNGSMTVEYATAGDFGTVNSNIKYATDETVFFYYNSTDVAYSVYVGYDNVPTLSASSTGVYAIYDGNTLLAMYVGSTPTDAEFNGDWMYIYDIIAYTSSTTFVDAVVNGVVMEDIEINATLTSSALGFQEFSIEDDLYELAATPSYGSTVDGDIDYIGSSSVVIDGAEYTVDSDAVVFEYIDKTIDVTNVSIASGDTVSCILDSGEIVVIIITANAP